MHKNECDWMDRGAPRKTWRSCVKRDMKAMGIKEEMAQDFIIRGCLKYRVCFGVTDVKRI